MRLLALDQASRVTGVAIFDDDKLVKYGTFEIKSNQELGKRLTQFLENLDKLYAAYHLMLLPMKIFNYKWAMSRHTKIIIYSSYDSFLV